MCRWDVSQLPSPPNPMVSIVKGDEHAPNWLKKLEVAKHVSRSASVLSHATAAVAAGGAQCSDEGALITQV